MKGPLSPVVSLYVKALYLPEASLLAVTDILAVFGLHLLLYCLVTQACDGLSSFLKENMANRNAVYMSFPCLYIVSSATQNHGCPGHADPKGVPQASGQKIKISS